jgi:hypothetical protein
MLRQYTDRWLQKKNPTSIMNLKKLFSEIQKRQIETFSLVSEFKDSKKIPNLPTKHRGLYWIWTDHSFIDLQKILTKPKTKEVPISELVSRRCELNNICKVSHDGYKIVYNGIGGYKKEPAAFGLRERINQELNCSDKRTGTLNLLNRFNDYNSIDNWAVSYFDFDDINNQELVKSIPFEKKLYLEHSKNLEIDWRIEFGIPILTRH